MLASPSIQKIASALAHSGSRAHNQNSNQARNLTNSSSGHRILCLRLQELAPSVKRPRVWAPVAEAFLKFSPRVQFREIAPLGGVSASPFATKAIWLFIDIASTSHLFHGEEGLMQSAMSLARDLELSVQCACSDTPAGAQAFAMVAAQSNQPTLIPPGEERERLKALSLPALLHLEGLDVWKRTSAVESVVTFFMMLGFKTMGDLSRFTLASLQERWGEVGELLWKRLNAKDEQPISPLLPTAPLEDYVHLDFPVSLVSLLLHQAQKSIDFLFARLQGCRLFAQKLVMILHCEYSKTQHRIELEPNTPNRDRELYVTLLENRLSAVDLENPIRDFEMIVVPCPETTKQLDFFEPRTTDSDKLQTLMNLLSHSSLRPGFYEIEPSVLPEKSWQLSSKAQPQQSGDAQLRSQLYGPRDAETSKGASTSRRRGEGRTETKRFTKKPSSHSRLSSFATDYGSSAVAVAEDRSSEWHAGLRPDLKTDLRTDQRSDLQSEVNEEFIAPTPQYGESVMTAPRPTRLLREPQLLPIEELQRLKILSRNPIERLESFWWENDTRRDYYFAVSPTGQCLWIFQDPRTEEYFLHGYFD